MNSLFLSFELFLLLPAALLLSWATRRCIQLGTRRGVRRATVRPGTWRARLSRLGDIEGEIDIRKRQRADAAARMLAHFSSMVIAVATVLIGLQILGVDPVYAVSSAGFIGLALALSGQEIIRNLLAGTMALLEDRYAVGDVVVFTVGGNEVRGTVDLMGATSVRVRTEDGATWHAGHGAIESVRNSSQIAASADILIPTEQWADVEDGAARRLAHSTNDIGLTGVVFLPELATQLHPTGVTTVTVKTNRPLTADQRDLVQERLTRV
nr:putative mechanosensitive ion channel [uncultured bacterium]